MNKKHIIKEGDRNHVLSWDNSGAHCSESECEVNMKKRTWVYVHLPADYDIACDICNGANITWSEYKGMIWCYDCEKDTPGNEGIFDGPIPYEITQLIGLSFDKIDLATGKRLYMQIRTDGKGVAWEENKG